MCKFSAYLAFNKMTEVQTDIKDDKAETLIWMSLSMDRVEMLPPSQRSSLENVFQLHCVSCISVCPPITLIKATYICRTFAHCFVLPRFKNVHVYPRLLSFEIALKFWRVIQTLFLHTTVHFSLKSVGLCVTQLNWAGLSHECCAGTEGIRPLLARTDDI